MQKIRYLTMEEKSRTRPLWEKIFTEDSEEFLDYYYSVKTMDNEILVLEKDDSICSMLQLNPYHLQLGDEQTDCAYVIAVATGEEYRHQGMMRQLLTQAMHDRYDRHQPFLFLMPADEAIYRPFGFRFVYEQLQLDLPGAELPGTAAGRNGRYCAEPVKTGEEGSAAVFANQILKKTSDMYACRDANYYRTLRSEAASEEGGLVWITEGSKRMGLAAYTVQDLVEVREPLILEEYRDQTEEILNACFGEFARPMHIYGLLPGEYPKEIPVFKKPVIMLRPLYLPAFLSSVRADQELEFVLNIADDILPENRGVFIWKIGPGESDLVRAEDRMDTVDMELSVEALTRLLFGIEDVDTVCREEHCIMTPAARRNWGNLRRGNRVFLNEVV